MSAVLGIGIGSRGAIAIMTVNAKAPLYNSFRHLSGDSIETPAARRLRTTETF
jgi:hypothetical protein